jgi:hypothetical protein
MRVFFGNPSTNEAVTEIALPFPGRSHAAYLIIEGEAGDPEGEGRFQWIGPTGPLFGGSIGSTLPGPGGMVGMAPPEFDQGDGEYRAVVWGPGGNRLGEARLHARFGYEDEPV